MHWYGFVLLPELCIREVLVLLVSRNGGHNLTPDSGLGLENPAYLVSDGSQKGTGCC